MRKAGIILVAAAVAAVFAGTSLAEGLRVAVIDVNKILNDSDAGQAAKKKMEARYEELKKTIDVKQEEARKIKEDLDNLLDEIDEILEENAEEFVKSYVQRGGQ